MTKSFEDMIREQEQEPFLNELPQLYKENDGLLPHGCPFCNGELFGRCSCCGQYFCHGKCEVGVYDMEEVLWKLQGKSDDDIWEFEEHEGIKSWTKKGGNL